MEPITVDELYNDLWAEELPEFEACLSLSLNPRAPQMLNERFLALGIGAGDTVMDLGCREGDHAIAFAQRLGCWVIALDPIPVHIERAAAKIEQAGVGHLVTPLLGRMEQIPVESGTVDYLWCRDVLNLVALPAGLSECFRVLRAGGRMLTYQNFATDLMEPREAERLYRSMAIRPDNMAQSYFEATARSIGFILRESETIGSEWRERGLEEGWGALDSLLLRLCRMRRQEEKLVGTFGRAYFEAAYGANQWLVYQALGKLSPVIHLLEKPGA